MKQKEIYIDPALGFEAEKMIKMLFAIKTVGNIDGFICSEGEYLEIFKNSYSINDLRTSRFYAVYTGRCNNCQQDFEILISNRVQLYNYLNSNALTCNACAIYNASVEMLLGPKIQ